MFEIQKSFYFEMGHRITTHGGKCFSPHGHSYKAIIYCKSTQLDEHQMVMDFGDISKYAQPIIDRLDHSFMVYEKDTEMVNFLNSQWDGTAEYRTRNFKFVTVPFESTAENIAKYIYEEFLKVAVPEVNKKRSSVPLFFLDIVSRVIVWETPKCAAEYRG